MAENALWYVVQTYSGYENAVETTINKHVDSRGLKDLIQQVYIPMETVTEITDKGPKEVRRKVFPGYVLIKMVLTDETWHIVRNVRGVTGFVGDQGDDTKALPLSDEEVAAWGIEQESVEIPYSVGDRVRIAEGPMESYLGVVEEIDMDKDKVRVVVSMFGRETPVELKLKQVTPVAED